MTVADRVAPTDDERLRSVRRLTDACLAEIRTLDERASMPWPELPDVRAMVDHLGVVHRWVTEILRTGGAVSEDTITGAPLTGLADWFDEGREALLAALAETPLDRPCWVLGRAPAVAGFWLRRMVFENVKHLSDLRAAGGGPWRVPAELTPRDYADGVDELFEVMLPRFRSGLPALPGAVVLEAADIARRWRIAPDWTIGTGAEDGDAAAATASAGDLAMAVWERARPLQEAGRFRIDGDRAVAGAFFATRIHPW